MFIRSSQNEMILAFWSSLNVHRPDFDRVFAACTCRLISVINFIVLSVV